MTSYHLRARFFGAIGHVLDRLHNRRRRSQGLVLAAIGGGLIGVSITVLTIVIAEGTYVFLSTLGLLP